MNLYPHMGLNIAGLGVYDRVDGSHKRTCFDAKGENERKLVVLEPGDIITCQTEEPDCVRVSIERPQPQLGANSRLRLEFVCSINEPNWQNPFADLYLESLLLRQHDGFLANDRDYIMETLFPDLEVVADIVIDDAQGKPTEICTTLQLAITHVSAKSPLSTPATPVAATAATET